jgi:peptidoglycan/xylan/chitin deacetylase (PgdA/CDA1 family)
MNAPASEIIDFVSVEESVVALTFDDGPHAAQTPGLLEILGEYQARATFFEIGDHVRKHPSLVRDVFHAGHEIGNHSKSHPDFGKCDDADFIRAELQSANESIESATGCQPKLFRAPYLSHSPALWTVLAELQLPSVGGRILGRDYNAAISKKEIIANCAAAERGDIIILHTWPEKTVAALPEILSRLREKGLQAVTVTELRAFDNAHL